MKTLICTALMVLFVIAATSCSATRPARIQILGNDDYIAGDHGIDASGYYTQEEVDTCQAITAANADACDPDSDIANGNLDAAE